MHLGQFAESSFNLHHLLLFSHFFEVLLDLCKLKLFFRSVWHYDFLVQQCLPQATIPLARQAARKLGKEERSCEEPKRRLVRSASIEISLLA
jgi:hypothetical protein